MPARKAETVPWASPAEACRLAPIDGRLGRYMLIARGPLAVSDPRRITTPQGVRSVWTSAVVIGPCLACSPPLSSPFQPWGFGGNADAQRGNASHVRARSPDAARPARGRERRRDGLLRGGAAPG